ncbi:MAG: ABC transporter permease [Acidobacteriota bacterium]|nr:ABC transporter permease [Acidobacteriota bacterium]
MTALIAIALGLGATTAVFSVVDPVLFRSLPYHDADRLVSLGMVAKVVGLDEFLFAADYKDFREDKGPFQSMTSWSGVSDCDITDRTPLRQRCAEVESNFLHLFGVRPILEQDFSKEDERPNAPRKVMLSYRVWKSRFGGDGGIVGKTLSLDGAPARIAGVLPSWFELPTLEHADLLTPQVVLDAGWQHGATRVLWVYGRLKESVTLKQARAQLAPAFARVLAYVPAPFRREVQFRIRSLHDREMQGAKGASWALFGAVIAVLLISCANVANLLLARSAGRQVELAIRAALGIGRLRLLRQMMAESLLLALGGGLLGCAFAAVLLRVLIAAAPDAIPHLANASLDGRVLTFSLAASIFSGLCFGLAPAAQTARTEVLGSSRKHRSESCFEIKEPAGCKSDRNIDRVAGLGRTAGAQSLEP